MKLNELTTIEQLQSFLDGTQICVYEVHSSKDARYNWIQTTLVQFRYITLPRGDKGILIRYLIKMSGYSRQQITRLIKQYRKSGKIVRRQQTTKGFCRRYTDGDIRLLAQIDELHETPCGAIVKKLCERAYQQFHDDNYEHLAGISVSHLYNLRQSKTYQLNRRHFTKTQSKPSSIGERRKPRPNQKPGYLRVDTVHQGDQDKKKGVYHINLVDEVTQFEICFSVEKISEAFLVPELESVLEKIPFKIRGFHTDNGSEYVNNSVAALLEKLNIEFTKSRPRRSNDNALAESKNGSVIRKHFGHCYIPQHWASEINKTLQEHLYRYQNFHKPCFFSITETDKNGKEKKRYLYENLMTPYEKLISLPGVEKDLKPNISLADLKCYAEQMSDQEAAKQLKNAKQRLFEKIINETA